MYFLPSFTFSCLLKSFLVSGFIISLVSENLLSNFRSNIDKLDPLKVTTVSVPYGNYKTGGLAGDVTSTEKFPQYLNS